MNSVPSIQKFDTRKRRSRLFTRKPNFRNWFQTEGSIRKRRRNQSGKTSSLLEKQARRLSMCASTKWIETKKFKRKKYCSQIVIRKVKSREVKSIDNTGTLRDRLTEISVPIWTLRALPREKIVGPERGWSPGEIFQLSVYRYMYVWAWASWPGTQKRKHF